jgi:SAM-dependent methyltransferase
MPGGKFIFILGSNGFGKSLQGFYNLEYLTDMNTKSSTEKNADAHVVEGFGDEWSRFDQSELSDEEFARLADNYFHIFDFAILPEKPVGFDLGAGSGRWARYVAPRVGTLHVIEPSKAIAVAKRNLAEFDNCEFHQADVDNLPLADDSMDFGYSLGVLHHIPDTEKGMQKCVDKLKPGAPFLVYLYYRFDNRPAWFRAIWKATDLARRGISRLPHNLRFLTSQVIAAGVYYPLARTALLLEKTGKPVDNFPLSQYRNTSFYTMRTDALDRFGTRLEQRFTKAEIESMMRRCGLVNISFSDQSFWTAVGYKRS